MPESQKFCCAHLRRLFMLSEFAIQQRGKNIIMKPHSQTKMQTQTFMAVLIFLVFMTIHTFWGLSTRDSSTLVGEAIAQLGLPQHQNVKDAVGEQGQAQETTGKAEFETRDHQQQNRRRVTIGLGRRRSHSTHYCLGPRPGIVDDSDTFNYPLFRSCHFTDVCFALYAPSLEEPPKKPNPKYKPIKPPAHLVYFWNNRDDPFHNKTAESVQEASHRLQEALKTSLCVNAAITGPNPRYDHAYKPCYLTPVVVPLHTDNENSNHNNNDKNHTEQWQDLLSRPKMWSPSRVGVPFLSHITKNFGHSIGDNLLCFYRLLKVFGLVQEWKHSPRSSNNNSTYHDLSLFDVAPLFWEQSSVDPIYQEIINTVFFPPSSPDARERNNRGQEQQRPINNTDSLLRHSSLEPPLLPRRMFGKYYSKMLKTLPKEQTKSTLSAKPPMLCFENVAAGTYSFSDHFTDPTVHGWNLKDSAKNHFWAGTGDVLLEFRKDIMSQMGVDPDMDLMVHQCQPSNNPPISREGDILVLPRPPGGKAMKPTGWSHNYLLTNWNTVEKAPLHVIDFSQHSFIGQVQLAAKAKVMVVQAGGSSFLSWFLPPGATVILLARDGKMFDNHIYDHMPYIHAVWVFETEARPIPNVKDGKESFYDWGLISQHIKNGVARYDQARQTMCD